MKTFSLVLSLLLPCLGGLLVGCGRSAPPSSGLATVRMTIGGKSYTLEVAAKVVERNKGLMYRDSMPTDHGMVFVFANEAERGFWMRNTRIPLDIVYLDAAGKVVSVHRMEPYDERSTVSKGPTKYAIELNAGEAVAAGVKEGDTLRLPDAVRNTRGDP